jgi:hypothetical protein
MNRKTFMMIVLTAVIVSAGAFAQQYRNGGGSARAAEPQNDLGTVIAELPLEELSQAEIDGLLLMREEEKLARDVYLTLADEWNIRSFANIARSEETHMEAVERMLDRYGIEDPVTDDTVGVFQNPLFSELYSDLVEQGKTSSLDALKVGAKIEELDIADLLDLMDKSDNQDIRVVYQNLLKGSRNHLRSFDMQIGRNGGSYVPEHLSAEEYARIASSPRETGTAVTDPDYLF